jgi:hypothetical protein
VMALSKHALEIVIRGAGIWMIKSQLSDLHAMLQER